MGLWARWNALPVTARYYVGFSFLIFAGIGEYVTSRVDQEVDNRKKILKELQQESEQQNRL
ncbi:hypothetical protein DFJ63DRAFT_334299 [Scheffersomyces coipomensis]|uniref:uncharacterized protein n=1 Tax=Scheffersomyces coipomensis TaxID=1788519 RepID=UPI00315D6860